MNHSHFEEAQRTLNILKESAEAEDINAFHASGNDRIGGTLTNEAAKAHGDNESSNSLQEWSSQTDDTSLSQGLSSLDMKGHLEPDGNSEDRLYLHNLEGLDEGAKVSLLAGMFSSLTVFDVKWTLKKYKWDVNRAIDELMTASFLEESGDRHRGIEAFSETDVTIRPRKPKGKRKGRVTKPQASSEVSGSIVASSLASQWDNGKQDIDFISTRTGVPIHQVNSIYHENGASLQATVSAIVEAHLALQLDLDDPIIQMKTVNLAHEFPTVPASKLEAIIQITHPSDAFAYELVKVIATPHSKKQSIQIDIRHTPLQLDPVSTPPKSMAYDALHPEIPLEASTAKVAKYTQARNAAFQKATALYRKGKSDHLMGGAAAYYSQQGRDADALARRAQSEAADARVASQSTKFELDLHGCNVNDAKRITKERVTAWWHELNQERGGGARPGSTLKVITGKGNHSEGRAGKLGPAVGKMLIRDGWKIEVTPGFLLVTGVAQTR